MVSNCSWYHFNRLLGSRSIETVYYQKFAAAKFDKLALASTMKDQRIQKFEKQLLDFLVFLLVAEHFCISLFL